ncbi:MAG: protease modulator HflK, partial [Burkholderiales bacterium]
TASRLQQESEGYKQRVIASAEGDAARFKQVLTEYAKAPAVTRDRLYIETMQQVLSNTSKVLVESRAGNNLLYLPLDRLLQQASADAARAQSGASGAQPADGRTDAPAVQAPPMPAGTRDGLRGRDRDSGR